jgi:dihydropteroate synthase
MKLHCADRILDLSLPQIMGVLNATPDSFSDGGQFSNRGAAINQAAKMLADGASIIDVGGESTRPGAKPVGLQQEMDRVIPIIERLSTSLDVCISVDTSSPEVMLAAKKAGAHMLNDVRALTRKGALQAAFATELPVCLMHMQGEPATMQSDPQYSQVVNDVYGYLANRIDDCCNFGIPKSKLLVDPGFGFGKSVAHNYQLLRQLERLLDLGVPVLAGLSRKSMIGAVLADRQGVDRDVGDRVFGSVSGAVIAAMNGARIIRVHDVKETADAMRVLCAAMSI